MLAVDQGTLSAERQVDDVRVVRGPTAHGVFP